MRKITLKNRIVCVEVTYEDPFQRANMYMYEAFLTRAGGVPKREISASSSGRGEAILNCAFDGRSWSVLKQQKFLTLFVPFFKWIGQMCES